MPLKHSGRRTQLADSESDGTRHPVVGDLFPRTRSGHFNSMNYERCRRASSGQGRILSLPSISGQIVFLIDPSLCCMKATDLLENKASLVDFCTLWFLRLNPMSDSIPSATFPLVLSSPTLISECFFSDSCPVSRCDLSYQVMPVTFLTCSGFVITSEISSAKLVTFDPNCLHVVSC